MEISNNQWLQLCYCIKEVDIEMAIKYSNDDWRITVLNREMPIEMEDEVRQGQTPVEEIIVPKKPRIGQKKAQQKKGGGVKESHPSEEKEKHTGAKGTGETH
jgi:hypothetical protein